MAAPPPGVLYSPSTKPPKELKFQSFYYFLFALVRSISIMSISMMSAERATFDSSVQPNNILKKAKMRDGLSEEQFSEWDMSGRA